MNPFASGRYQPTRPLRYHGQTRIEPRERIDLHRSLYLPYYLEVTDFYVGVRAGSRQYARNLAALCVVGLLIATASAAAAIYAGVVDVGFLMIGGMALLALLGGILMVAEMSRESEECLTYLRDQDRFLSCFWENEPQRAQVNAFYLRKRKHFVGDDARWLAELTLSLIDPKSAELFVASGHSMHQMKPLAETLARECGIALHIEES